MTMDHWEFLIQQEGDQTWLPLETKQVEILEGRYRAAVHSSLTNTPVEIRVSQLILDEMPPRRRVRKRRGQTSESGLLVVFPYMQLHPGRWEIHCSSVDVLSDFLGAGWERFVQLEVLPRDEDWDPDWTRDPAGTLGSSEDSTNGRAIAFTHGEPAGEPAKADASATTEASQTTIEVAADSAFGLQLTRQALVAQLGKPLQLEGEIFNLAGESLPESEIAVQLRDPRTAQILLETRQHLPAQTLPARLSVTIALRLKTKTRVILGGVAIRPKSGGDPDTPALASAAFTVTMGLHDLLDAIASQTDGAFEEEISIFPGSTEPFIPPDETPATLIAPELPLAPPPRYRVVPAASAMPPQIYAPPPDLPAADRSPELPSLPTHSTAAEDDLDTSPWDESEAAVGRESAGNAIADSDSDPEIGPASFFSGSVEDEDVDAELVAAALSGADDLEADLHDSDFDSGPNSGPSGFEGDRPTVSPTVSPTISIDGLVNQSFQSLNLQARFWNRLSALTFDGHQAAAKLRSEMVAAGVEPPSAAGSTPAMPLPGMATPASSPTADKLTTGAGVTDEVVVDDERSDSPEISPTRDVPVRETPVHVAPPKLDVPEQDLVAGELVSIRLRLQAKDYRPYAKVWMNDRQTRALIDEPRLVMHFTPNSFGELETLMRIKVPLGCLELQIAAIAIDMATLQESSRTVVNRYVLPPSLPAPALDDFDA